MQQEIVVIHSDEYGQKGFHLERHSKWAESEEYIVSWEFYHELFYHILPDEIGKVEQELHALGVFLYLQQREASANTAYTIISTFNDSYFPNLPECPKDYSNTVKFMRFHDNLALFEDLTDSQNLQDLRELVLEVTGNYYELPNYISVIQANRVNIVNWLCYGYENSEKRYKYCREAILEFGAEMKNYLIRWTQRTDTDSLEDGIKFNFNYDIGTGFMELKQIEEGSL